MSNTVNNSAKTAAKPNASTVKASNIQIKVYVTAMRNLRKGNQSMNEYAVVKFGYNPDAPKGKTWAIQARKPDTNAPATLYEPQLIAWIQKNPGMVVNADVKDGKIVSRGASFDRFKKTGMPWQVKRSGQVHKITPMLLVGIVTSNYSASQRPVAYRVWTYESGLIGLYAEEVVKYAAAAQKAGRVPFQNAMYVPGRAGQMGFFRPYNDGDFIVENIRYETKQPVTVKPVEKAAEDADKQKKNPFNKEQMEQLRLGREHGVDIKQYAHPAFNAKQMEALRLQLERGINPQRFRNPCYQAQKMRFFTQQLAANRRITEIMNPAYTYPQMQRISYAMSKGLDISRIQNPKMSIGQMDDEIIHMEIDKYKDIDDADEFDF